MPALTAQRSGPAVIAGLFAAGLVGPSGAHAPDGVGGSTTLSWTFEPWVMACLAVTGLWYALGAARLWRHAGAGRGLSRSQCVSFTAGWVCVALALVSPLDALGALLFSAHMVQHELLMVVAAPLLVLGRPLAVAVWALPARWRRPVGRAFSAGPWHRFWHTVTTPLSAWSLHALMLWAWHIPSWFDAALRSGVVHGLQHASFLAAALLLWWSALGPRSRHARAVALMSLFTTMVHTAALGALMTLSPLLWYEAYARTSNGLGVDPLTDQQLGGLVMWVPAGAVYLVVALAIARLLLRDASAVEDRAEVVVEPGR